MNSSRGAASRTLVDAPFGSLEWARHGRGRVTRREQWLEVARAVVSLTRAAVPRALGFCRRQLERAIESVPVPSSDIARAADQLCVEVSSPALAGHCRRTYLWAALLAERDGLRFDAELLMVTSLLHDLGLVDRFGPSAGETECFAHAGAETALRWAQEHAWDTRRRQALADAICFHLNAHVPLSVGVEAHLLRQGSALDVIGLRVGEIGRQTRAAVLARHPRQGFTREVANLVRRQALAHPRSRIGCLVAVGFARQIDRAPFPD